MSHTLDIAKKEFYDLVSDKSIFAVIIIFTILIMCSAVYTHELFASNDTTDSFLSVMMNQLSYAIMSYGSIVAIMFGFFSITKEKIGHSINTLIAKPLYRDTIINGKLIACTTFLFCGFLLATCVYTSLIAIFFGNEANSILSEFILRLPVLLCIVTLDALCYMSLSIFLSIIVKRPGVSLLSTLVLFIFFDLIVPTASFADNINLMIQNDQIYRLLLDMSPYTSLSRLVTGGLYDSTVSVNQVITVGWPDMVRLIIFVVILLFMCYSTFIRRDIV